MRRNQQGNTLIGAVIATLIFSIGAVAVSRMNAMNVSATKVNMLRGELDLIRQNINENLNCTATLGLTSLTATPLNCANYSSVTLRNADRTLLAPGGKIGKWSLTAGCHQNKLRIAVNRPGKDPVTKKPWSSLGIATDLFEGMGRHCQKYFRSKVVPHVGGSYQLYVRSDGTASGCRSPNAYTGQCSCPRGYFPEYISSFVAAGPWTYSYDPVTGAPRTIGACTIYGNGTTNKCGVHVMLCAKASP